MIKRIVLSTDQSKLSKVMTAQVGQPLDPAKIREHARITDLFLLQCNITSSILQYFANRPDDAVEQKLQHLVGSAGKSVNSKITSWSTAADNNQDGETGHTLQMDDITLSIVVTADHAK